MNDATPSLKQLNRTFIGSVLFIDIVGYSTRTVPDQLEMKELFNTMLAEAVQNVAASERIMVDTGDGAGIAFLGDPEDALFAALSLRDSIEACGITVGEPGFVRMGINLGPLKIVRDINGHTNMIGDGVNDAQRVMSFSEPGQVMVSHSYFDIISRFSRDYTQLFVYEGTRQDKHVREHEVYRFGPVKDTENLAAKLRDRSRARQVPQAEAPARPMDAPAGSAKAPSTNPAAATVASGGKSRALRPGMIATAIGAASLVGAVWSWSSKPQSPPAVPASSPSSPISQVPAGASEAVKVVPAAQETQAAKSPDTKIAIAPKNVETASKQTSPGTGASESDAGSASQEKTAKPAEPPPKPGTVKLAVQPWGEIYVDGGKRGVTPPLKSLTLPPGKHRIEIRNGSFAPYKETIEVKSGAESTVQYVF